MSDDIQFNTALMFGSIELHEAPPRIDGNRLILRNRTIERDRYGNVVRDETHDGVCVTGWEDCSHLFGVAPPPRPPKSLWNRVCDFLF
jgi:hypothetical protein